jgi:hypothetical protein
MRDMAKRRQTTWYSLSLWERAGVRAAALHESPAATIGRPMALTPTLSQRERELPVSPGESLGEGSGHFFSGTFFLPLFSAM